jgi:hypothetical protein
MSFTFAEGQEAKQARTELRRILENAETNVELSYDKSLAHILGQVWHLESALSDLEHSICLILAPPNGQLRADLSRLRRAFSPAP